MTWFDNKTQNEVLNFEVFGGIRKSISVPGLTGLDRLICFTIVIKLQVSRVRRNRNGEVLFHRRDKFQSRTFMVDSE